MDEVLSTRAEQVAGGSRDGDAMRLLIVEDEAITALHLEALLQDLGHQVCAVEATGEGAIRAAERHQPDLVLMDVRLAGQLDGISAAARIRNQYGIPSLLVTAYTDPGTQARARECEALGLIPKPYTTRQVERTLAGVLQNLAAMGHGHRCN